MIARSVALIFVFSLISTAHAANPHNQLILGQGNCDATLLDFSHSQTYEARSFFDPRN